MNDDYYYADGGTGFGWIVRAFDADTVAGTTDIEVERGWQGSTTTVIETINFVCNSYGECADHLIQHVSAYANSTGPVRGGGFPIKHM